MIDQVNYTVILILIVQCILVAGIFLSLFRLSQLIGDGLLFAAIGVCQFMQVFLFNTISYELFPGLLISPGSAVLFSANLFLALAIYIRKDAETVRTLIYALIASDFLLGFLRAIIGFHLDAPAVVNHYQLPPAFFTLNTRAFLVGTTTLLLDSILMILIYEYLSKKVPKLFFRIFLTMALVLTLDAVLFSLGTFLGHQAFWNILLAGVIGKFLASCVFSILFALVLPYVKDKKSTDAPTGSFQDMFSWLTYRQKFEYVTLEKEQQQKALQESERKYRALFEQGADAIYLARMDGQILGSNQRASLQLDFSKDEFLQKKLQELHPAPVKVETSLDFWKNLEPYETIHQECEHQKKDGSTIPVEITSSKIVFSGAEHILCFVRDITGKKEAERKEVELANRHRTLLQTSLEGFILIRQDGDILEVNDTYCQMVGYTQEELLKMNILELDVDKSPAEVQEIILDVLEKGWSRFEAVHRHKQGKEIQIEVSVSQVHHDGKFYTMHFCRDITAAKQLTNWRKLNASILERTTKGEPLKSILMAVVEGIEQLIPNTICSIMLMNDARLLSVVASKKLPIEWITYIDQLAPGPKVGSCGTAVYLRERVVSSDIQNDSKWEGYQKMAAKFDLKACWSEPIIENEQDDPLGTFGVYHSEIREPTKDECLLIESVAHLLAIIIKKMNSERDLAEYRTQLEKKVKLRTLELENINQELKSFSYSVSHDLRAPLTRLDGFSKVLQDRYADKLDEKGMHYLSRIRASSKQMAVLIDDLLHLSRISRREVSREKINLGELAEEIMASIQEGEPNRKVQISMEPELFTWADKSLTRILLENLLQNAWKFSREKEETVIKIGKVQLDNDHFFFIKDNGIGFDMRYYQQLFRPFQRLHPSTEVEGHGIGLATVQRIINKHEGLIKAESVEGKGTTFYFNLANRFESLDTNNKSLQ